MKLREFLEAIGDDMNIRIFAGCITIFQGKKSDVSEKEWNLNVRPYMDGKIINSRATSETIMVMI